MMRMMMNDDHCYCWYWWSFLFTCDWPAASESVLEAGPVPDVSPQHVWATKSQRGAWEDEGRLERPGWAAEPTTDHTTVVRQDTILKITASLQGIQIISDRLNTANVLMPKLACTRQISVFPRDLGQSSQRVQKGEDLDAAMARGLSSFDPNICTEVSMRSVLPNKKSAGNLFVLLWEQLVLEELHDRVNNTHVTVDLVNTDRQYTDFSLTHTHRITPWIACTGGLICL